MFLNPRPCTLFIAALLSAPALPGIPMAAAQQTRPAAPVVPDPKLLVGTWKVDLRPTPDAAPYYQYFVIKSVDGGITGTFYQSEIHEGRINKNWNTVYFAFTTSDARERGTYNTAGRLVNGKLEGTTHSIGRGFLSVWTAERVSEKPEAKPSTKTADTVPKPIPRK